mgnify:CR=1 FL=1
MSIMTRKHGAYFVLTMQNEGKFNPDSLAAFNAALDAAENDTNAAALLITGEGKTFAQGLDLAYLGSVEFPQAMEFVDQCMFMIARLLQFPVPVVSAINGHAFGLGAMIVLASDYKVMREDRGFFCLPEVDLNMVLPASMNALVKAKMPGVLLRDCLLAGARRDARQLLAGGLIDESCNEESLLNRAMAVTEPMQGKDRATLMGLKAGINSEIIDVIEAQRN